MQIARTYKIKHFCKITCFLYTNQGESTAEGREITLLFMMHNFRSNPLTTKNEPMKKILFRTGKRKMFCLLIMVLQLRVFPLTLKNHFFQNCDNYLDRYGHFFLS